MPATIDDLKKLPCNKKCFDCNEKVRLLKLAAKQHGFQLALLTRKLFQRLLTKFVLIDLSDSIFHKLGAKLHCDRLLGLCLLILFWIASRIKS